MLYARKTIDGNCVRRQTLKAHSWNVANVTAKTCKLAGIKYLGLLAGLVHDFAKTYFLWQQYLENGGQTVFHAPYAVEFIQRCFGEITAPYADLTRQMLSMAVRAHHGGLHDALTPSGEQDLPGSSAYSHEETAQADEAFFDEVCSKLELQRMFLLACGEVEAMLKKSIDVATEPKKMSSDKQTCANEAMAYAGFAQRFLYAALIDADRLDAACWELEESPPEEPLPNWEAMLQNLEGRLKGYSREGIGKLRADISRQCGEFDAPSGIYWLFVPTGGGKTLSSLRLALSVASTHGKRRIIYAEPYLTILSQAADEIRKAIGEHTESVRQDSAVLEFHSNVVFEEDDPEREMQYSRLSERLDKPIVLTSTIQLLNSFFSGKSACARRMAALANSVLIIDEVQAIPTDSTYLFSMAMNYLARFCGCLVILCTATPPALDGLKYPIRMSSPSDVVGGTQKLFAAFKRTQIVPVMDKGSSAGDMAVFVSEKLKEHGNCLVIVNTKAVAKKLLEFAASLEPEYRVFYLSTELCTANRDAILADIKNLLPDGKVLVISTQLIEAGVDISFKCVIRAFAGLDSIIQAAGRCNRHGEAEMGMVYVVNCQDESLAMLPDIDHGKGISLRLAATFADRDLSSPEMVCRYYEEYFLKEQARLDYGIEKKRSAVALLGNNLSARVEYKKSSAAKYPPYMLAQSFKAVGSEYKPIKDDTTGVVTPFGNSAEILEKLKSSDGRQKQHYIRTLQKFCVNVYNNRLQSLKDAGAVSFDEENGIWILAKDAYSETTGINTSCQESVDNYIL